MCKQKKSNPKDEIKTSLVVVDHAWAKIVGTMKIANSSNFAHVKLVKVLKRCGQKLFEHQLLGPHDGIALSSPQSHAM
jgi:hypothetical protein